MTDSPELWARHHQKHQLTPNGLWWEWVPLNGNIDGKRLEFISRATVDGVTPGDYIIALKLENQTEVAQPIG